MNRYLETIKDLLQQNNQLAELDKEALLKAITDADKQWNITDFKLDRTEKVKKTTAILLEETIAELENKRKAIEAQNRELEIEGSLERVRSVAMGMKKPEDMLEVCKTIAHQLDLLKVKDIRNVQTAIFHESKSSYANYEFYVRHDKALVTEVEYANHPVSKNFAEQMLKGPHQVWIYDFKGKEVKDWLEYHKSTNVFIDTYLEHADTLNYYWYSLGPVAIGMSAYTPLGEQEIELFKRFRNVFDLAYRRYLDIEKAEAQAREANIEAALEKVRSKANAMHRSEHLHEVIKEVHSQLTHIEFRFDSADFLTDYTDKGYNIWLATSDPSFPSPIFVSSFDHRIFHLLNEEVKQGHDFFTFQLTQEEKDQYFKHVFETALAKYELKESRQFVLGAKGMATSCVVLKNIILSITNFASIPYTDEENSIIKRFAYVFEQSYIRFLDLKKAEAQAREGQIELALERVRARTMAMQNSNELAEAAQLLYEEFRTLGIHTFLCGYCFIKEAQSKQTVWVTLPDGTLIPDFIDFPLIGDQVLNKRYEDWKQKKPLHVLEIQGEVNKEHHRFLASKVADATANEIFAQIPDRIVFYCANFSAGYLFIIATDLLTTEEEEVIIRFARVFELTYTRFSDLKQAEQQARESQIQLALERVRARTMAMQKSDELAELMITIFKSITSLGIPDKQIEVCYITTFDPVKPIGEIYLTNRIDGSFMPDSYKIPFDEEPFFKTIYERWKNGESFYVGHLEGQRLYDHFQYMRTHTSLPALQTPEEITEQLSETFSHVLYFSQGYLAIVTRQPVDSFHPIFMRFGNVLQQTYTRFLDLQKAEANARESQIEAALERVRARAMAMHKADDLNSAVAIVFEELDKLNLGMLRCGIGILNKENRSVEVWSTSASDKGTTVQVSGDESMDIHPLLQGAFDAWLKQTDFSYTLQGEDLFHYYKAVGETNIQLPQSQTEPTTQYYYVATFGAGGLFAFREAEFTEEGKTVMKRFANVFNLTYKRFLDLQKAEAQAREAQIEAALEKIRNRSLAMQKSDELKDVIAVVFEKLKGLGLIFDGSGIQILKAGSKDSVMWIAFNDMSEPGFVAHPYDEEYFKTSEILKDIWKSIETREEIFNKTYSLEEKNRFFEYVDKHNGNSNVPDDKKEWILQQTGITLTFVPEKNSSLWLDSWTGQTFSLQELNVLKRIAKVFEQAYTRFLDLQNAEAQAREAQIEAALERVRSRTLAMQKSDELAETASVLFRQLILLGIEPNRLYITIVRDEKGEAEFWITDEDGGKVSMAYTTNLNANPSFKKMYDGWKAQKRSLMIDLQGEELEEFVKRLTDLNVPFKGGPSQKRRLQYIAYFSKGFIGMASPDAQTAETMQLLERFAAVFNLTFTRFNDLKIAEAHALQAEQDLIEIKAAKKRAEDTLTELQATQKQLVQSEKMASLGELTAGIAHEIQNPLNFVNNFSDVSNELLEEMKTELEKGNTKDVVAIVGDVKQNLEKILYHGKRADAIVKGMLQHSRTSSGQKELTDINALADEYLRLAYHGLRAKDKSFNAKFITDFDKNVDKINIIPQEIGRVILNLINNAFYAVSEKTKASQSALGGIRYEPTVIVSTKKAGDKVMIGVKDNGIGIAQKNLDKIFQPFFTSKPTGQGTGLGLSISYDIVNAHGGEIIVNTKEGEGSEFVIQLPLNL